MSELGSEDVWSFNPVIKYLPCLSYILRKFVTVFRLWYMSRWEASAFSGCKCDCCFWSWGCYSHCYKSSLGCKDEIPGWSLFNESPILFLIFSNICPFCMQGNVSRYLGPSPFPSLLRNRISYIYDLLVISYLLLKYSFIFSCTDARNEKRCGSIQEHFVCFEENNSRGGHSWTV